MRPYSILLATALGAACVGSPKDGAGIDGGDAPASHASIQWPIQGQVSSFITQSAAHSNEPFPCGSGVNAQHVLLEAQGENHDYEQSLDIVARPPAPATDSDTTLLYDGRGTDIVAVADGIVVAVGSGQSECVRNVAAGNYVVVEHPQIQRNGAPVLSVYMHLNSSVEAEEASECRLNPAPVAASKFRSPDIGSAVIAGQKIGELGNTGNSTGPHLHFQFATNCTLEPANKVDCVALSILDINSTGFSNTAVARDSSCPTSLGIGGPVATAPSPAQYLSDGSYVTATSAGAPAPRLARDGSEYGSL